MNRIFIISDTHFGHKNIIKYEPLTRPFSTIEEHDEELVKRWNSTVKPNDTVWHLGDVLFNTNGFEILGRLNGLKKLVMGNHDKYPTDQYLKYFKSVYGCAVVQGCIFTHIPVHHSQFNRFKLNVHGHLHNHIISDSRYVNVSADQINLTPVLLDLVIHAATKT